MHARTCLFAAMALLLPTGCDDPAGGLDDEPGATDGAPEDTDGGPGDGPGDGPEDGGDADGGGADGDGGSDGDPTGEPGDGYPAEVTDALELPWPPYDYDEDLPAHFQTPVVRGQDNTPADNTITDAGATLGRVLFYDRALSANHTISCASCHAQDTGFSDTAVLSEGFDGGLTGRNSMGLANARFYDAGHFFWDERANTLEDQVLMPIQDPVEMGLTLDELVERVSAQPYYPVLFADAFGDETIDTERISWALSQFVRSIVSYRAPWDEGITAAAANPGGAFPNYTAQQNRGKDVFFGAGRCAVCHLEQPGPPPPPGAPLGNAAVFMLTEAANNGLDAGPNDDNGLGDAFDDPSLNGMFKSPSLRNVELTGPYMHDGRFDTLRQVIDHYDSGVQDHPNLDPRLRQPGPGGGPQRLNLSNADKDALEAFLRTLTDEALLEDPRFSDPFRE